MINIVFSSNSVIAIIWVLTAIFLQLLTYIYPRIADQKDSIISACLLISGYIMFVHGWRLDPILLLIPQLLTVVIGLCLNDMLRTRYKNCILKDKLY